MSQNSFSETANSNGEDGEYVTVTIRDQLFGLPIGEVEDVFEPQMVTRVPMCPPEVVGVLNLRGRIVSLIDICSRLGMNPLEPEKPMAIGLRREGGTYALLVDEVGDVIHPETGTFEPVPSHLDQRWKSVCTGVHQLEDKLMMVLDPDCVFENESESRVA